MDRGALVHDDERALELPHVLRVDPEVGLKRKIHLHALGHVDEGPAAPHRAVQRGELVVRGRNDRAEVLPEELRVLLQSGARVEEDDALLGEGRLDLVIDRFGVVLGAHAGEELLLGLGNPETVEGLLDVRRHLVPGLPLLLGRLQVVVDVLEVDLLHLAAPAWQRLLLELLERLEAELLHPGGLVLDVGDLRDHVLVQAAARLEDRLLLVVEPVLLFVSFSDVQRRLLNHGSILLWTGRLKRPGPRGSSRIPASRARAPAPRPPT